MIDVVLSIGYLLLIAIFLTVFSAYFWQWLYESPTDEDEIHYVRTADGWNLAIHRYRPTKESPGLPVILCHGLSSNRYTFDLPGASSLARFLRDRGRDVWVAELRGSGMSDHPRLLKSDVPHFWDFEDHLLEDLPAIINEVIRKSGASAAHWVGHSMGGMLIRAHLASNSAPIASAVTLASPLDFSKLNNNNFSYLLKLKNLVKPMPILPLTFLSRLAIPVVHLIPRAVRTLFHPPNIDPGVARRVLALAAQLVTSSKLWLSMGRFLESGIFGPNGEEPYLKGAPMTDVPVLVVAGSADAMAPAPAVTAEGVTTDLSGQIQCLILGKETGCREDYGHMDLVVGLHVETEVFPRIEQWIGSHDVEEIRET
jgi:pimeloyl-ACP methyl ester carboxylesterase